VLNQYLQDTQNYLHDPNGTTYQTSQLTTYINRARSQVAMTTQCVRVLQVVNLTLNQETYPLPNVDADGIGQVLSIFAISVPWSASFKPTIERFPFSIFQANFRVYGGTVTGFPEAWAQLGSGSNGTAYVWPLPSQSFASEWDCVANVLPLGSDSDPEAIPYGFSDAVALSAAAFALIGAQRFDDAQKRRVLYQQAIKEASAARTPVFVGNAYR
jgi:hypothetical protein